jgi:GntR family transcriptional regulator
MAVCVEIDLDSRISFERQFREQLEKLVVLGQARPGNRLPTVRELAVATGINANYLKHLLRRLREDGVVQWKEGVGAFAVDLAAGRTAAEV